MTTTEEMCTELRQLEMELWRHMLLPDLRVLASRPLPLAVRQELARGMPLARLLDADQWREWMRRSVALTQVNGLAAITALRNRIVENNMGLAWRAAKKTTFRRRGSELDDLAQQGALGLIRATERFDSSKGFKFATYACWWIDHSIERYMDDVPEPVRLPVHLRVRSGCMIAIEREMTSRIGRPATVEEIVSVATKRGVLHGGTDGNAHVRDATRVERMNNQARLAFYANLGALSLDQQLPSKDDDGGMLHDLIADPTSSHATNDSDVGHDLGQVLKAIDCCKLSAGAMADVKPSELLLARAEGQTLKEIGDQYGVTRERVRQIENRGLRLARSHLRIKVGRRTVSGRDYPEHQQRKHALLTAHQ